MSLFQIILFLVFGVFIMAGFVVTAMYSRESQVGGSNMVQVTVWGTLPYAEMRNFFDKLTSEEINLVVTYSQKNEANYDREIVEAIAAGQSPDIVLITQADIIKNLNKLYIIPYKTYDARTFKDSFIEEGELFLTGTGIYALPFTIDPLVMYWNRDLLSSAGFGNPPKYWDELYYYTEKLAKKDVTGSIQSAAVAMGDYQNIDHAKSVLAGLFFQKNNKITYWADGYKRFLIDLGEEDQALKGAVDFYTQFSNVTKTSYTWNRSLPDSKTMFVSGKLAIYFGLASEIKDIRNKNPNLNFDVAVFPQLKNSSFRTTYGDIYGMAILRSSKNIASALQAVNLITSRENISSWVSKSYLPPVRRDLSVPPGDASLAVFQESAVMARGWLDPDKEGSDKVFSEMISSIVSGRDEVASAIGRAASQLRALIPKL